MKRSGYIFLAFSVLMLLAVLPGCQKKESVPGEDELMADPSLEETSAEEKPEPKAPVVRMNEDLYIEITARSALIRDKHADDPEQAEREIEALYEKAGVTYKEYREFAERLSPLQHNALQKKIVEAMQKIGAYPRFPQ